MTIEQLENKIKKLQEELEVLKIKEEKEDRIEKYYDEIYDGVDMIDIALADDVPYKLVERETRKTELQWELRKLLYDNNAIPSEEDWKNSGIDKHFIYYSYKTKNYNIDFNNNYIIQGTIYSLDKEILENWFDNLSDEDKKIFVRG